MHMADALISPVVGGTMWAAAAGVAAYSIRKLQNDLDEKKIPLMGVMGAFVFAAQMINFAIPGTGSSGHIGGGMLLAILLGPYAGFVTLASVLLIQALFFADGGLLAFGCNVFNMGFFTCFIAYSFIYMLITRKGISAKRIFIGVTLSTVIGLQLGSFGVVLQTFLSGITELPFDMFLIPMQLIHLAISIIEGLITTAVVTFIWRTRPEIIEKAASEEKIGKVPIKKVIVRLVIATVIIGGLFSWYASANPDGLEWSIFKVAGETELKAPEGIHEFFAQIQEKLSFLPGYGFKSGEEEAAQAGTSVSGLVGGALTLAFVAVVGVIISIIKGRNKKSALKRINTKK